MNPELQRNLRLELSPHRLVLMPLVLWVLFLLVYLAGGQRFGSAVASTAALLFFALTALWGARAVADNLFTEVSEHTWDIQRLSALTPGQMTFGKLAGATLMPWYGGLICLAVAVAASPLPMAASLKLAVTWLSAALCVQALAMTLALFAVMRGLGERSNLASILLALLIIWALARAIAPLDSAAAVQWYGWRLPLPDFALASTVLFAGWAVLAASRTMALALSVRTLPWAWPAFTLFATAWLGGLVFPRWYSPASMLPTLATVGFAVAGGLTYLAAILEQRDPFVLRRLATYRREGRLRRCLQTLPIWTTSMLLAAGFAVVCTLAGQTRVGSGPEPLGTGAIAATLLILRDLGLLYFLALRTDGRRPETTLLVYLLLLYLLLPRLFIAAGMPVLAGLVLPELRQAPLAAAIIAAIQAGVVAALLTVRWRARVASGPAGP